MKIARVVTVCAALITTFLGVGRVHSKRRPLSRDQSPQQGRENGTDASEITFTTLRPEVPSFSHNTRSNVYQGFSKWLRFRPGRSMPIRLRGPNLLNGSRRRRQLQHHSVKSGHVARSFEFGDNRIENQHIETVQPPEAFGKGVIRIEPIYRVTKNKNIFDSIIDIVRRIINPPKSVGSLVGPFHFPGVGDKVYVRLLEQDRPDHVVIRLISHLCPEEIDSSFHRNIPIASKQLLGESEMPSVHQATIALPKEVLSGSHNEHGDVKLISSDNFLTASNNLAQATKTMNAQGQRTEQANDLSNGEHILKTYETNVKQGDANGSHGVVRHQKRNPYLGPIMNNNNNNIVNSHLNKTQDHERYQDSFEHTYHFHSPINDSSKENFASFDVNYQAFQYPRNISTPVETFYNHPINPFDTFLHSPIPTAIDRSKNSSRESNADGPKYSIEFASKEMSYLNLDGSVEPAIKDDNSDNFEHARLGPVDRQWKPITGITRETTESSTDKKDRHIFQERSDDNSNDELAEIDWKSSEDLVNYLRNATSSTDTVKLGKRGSRCCLQQEDENQNAKFNSGERLTNETIGNNSTDGIKSANNQLQLQRLQSNWRNVTNPRKV